jgi:hypothetical protein
MGIIRELVQIVLQWMHDTYDPYESTDNVVKDDDKQDKGEKQ